MKLFLPPANEVWGKVIFFHLSVILFTGGEYLGRYTPQAGISPPGQVHPHTPKLPRVCTSLGRYTTVPLAGTSPWAGTPLHGSSACWEIRATSRRYASYWNAFLYVKFFSPIESNSSLIIGYIPIFKQNATM